jgi:hypothetical protein
MTVVRRLVVLAVVLVGLLVVVDRVAVALAQRDVARRIQVAQHLESRPDVHIGGFPLLTQVVRGRYDDVEVTLRNLSAGPLRVDRLRTHLFGARVPLGDVVQQRVGTIPTERATAEVLLRYDDVERLLSTDHIQLSEGNGGRLHVEASVDVAGAGLAAGADVPVVVQNGTVVFQGPAGVQLRVPLPGLPFHLRLKTAKATQDGIVIGGSADGLVLRP